MMAPRITNAALAARGGALTAWLNANTFLVLWGGVNPKSCLGFRAYMIGRRHVADHWVNPKSCLGFRACMIGRRHVADHCDSGIGHMTTLLAYDRCE